MPSEVVCTLFLLFVSAQIIAGTPLLTPGGFLNGGKILPSGAKAPDLLAVTRTRVISSGYASAPPANFMASLVNTQCKLLMGTPLCKDESKLWQSISSSLDGSHYCANFVLRGKEALCCYVRVSTVNYGFCTFKSLFSLSNRAISSSDSDCFFTNPKKYTTAFPATNSPYETYIDLFSKQCTKEEMMNLCAIFCCDERRNNSVFCNSDMDCY